MNAPTFPLPDNTLSIVILAAGMGKRMKSSLPKVLHPIAGKALLAHVIDTAQTLAPDCVCVVYGHGGDQVQAAFLGADLKWALQSPQLGTGHAVLQALPQLPCNGVTLVLYGDVPLITANTLAKLIASARAGKVGWLTQHMQNPTGLGRIVRDANGQVRAIIEEKDATAEQRAITEINTGFVALPTGMLAAWLPTLTNNNAASEYYLTELLAIAVAANVHVETPNPAYEWEVVGVNSKDQLAELERTHQRNIAHELMVQGVMLADPSRIDVRGTLTCEQDVSIDVNCVVEGNVSIGRGTKIGANCVIRNATIGSHVEVLPFTHMDDVTIGDSARIGPYARLRPGAALGESTHVGNFCEVKASTLGARSKVNHLSYIGDSTVGEDVNIGAGTITCNYDGANKHRTVIGDRVHIGSDVQLVAPVSVGHDADIAAGTTVWNDVPAGGLALNTKTQVHKPEWKRPVKKKT